MAQTFDICIRGAGIVGRAAALLLARDRHRVALFPGPTPLAAGSNDVRAYALNSASRSVLESLRCWPDASHATAVTRMRVQGDDGGAVHFDAAQQGVDALAWVVDVPALEAQLAEAVRFQPHVEVVDAPVHAALTVVCEGRASTTRSEFGVEYRTTPYPQHAIATRLICEHPHGQVARQWFGADGSILAFLPLDGPQGNSVAVVWSIPDVTSADVLKLDDDAFVARLAEASGGALGALQMAAPRACWPLQLAQANRWCGWAGSGSRQPAAAASWVLAGDAAHTVHPLAGQGLNLGLGDVAALAEILRGRDYWRSVGDLHGLRAYERQRKVAVAAMGLATDGLQQLFARPQEGWQALRNWGMRGFDRSGALKRLVVRSAMGLQG